MRKFITLQNAVFAAVILVLVVLLGVTFTSRNNVLAANAEKQSYLEAIARTAHHTSQLEQEIQVATDLVNNLRAELDRQLERQAFVAGVSETLVVDVQGVREVVTDAIRLSHTTSILEARRFRSDIEQYIRHYGIAYIATDLSGFTAENVIIDTIRETIWVSIPRPRLLDIAFDFENTYFGDTVSGRFARGDIQLTPEVFNDLMRYARAAMELEVYQRHMAEAYVHIHDWVADFVGNVLVAAGVDGYRIEVLWL